MGLLSGKDQVQKSTTVPWAVAQPHLKSIMSQAAGLNKAGAGFKAPGFATYAPMGGRTQAALGGMWGAAQGPNPLAGMSEGALSSILSGDIASKYGDLLSGADNPHWAAAVQNQSDRIADDVAARYSLSGRYGSDAMTGDLVRELGDYRTGALSSKWDQNIANMRGILGDQVGAQMGAIAAAPGAYQQRFAPYERQAQVGGAYDDLAARKLQSRIDAFNTNQQAPWNRLNAFQGAVTGAGGGASSTTSSVQQPSNPWGGLLGGVLGGASLGSAIPGIGTLLGGAGGGLLGLLSGL